MLNIELHTVLNNLIEKIEFEQYNVEGLIREATTTEGILFWTGGRTGLDIVEKMIKDILDKLVKEDAAALGKMKEEEEMKAKVLMGCYDFDPKKEFAEEAKKLDKGLKALESLCKHCQEAIQSIPTKEKPEGTIQIPNAPHSLCPFIHIDGTHCPAYTELVDVILDKDKKTPDPRSSKCWYSHPAEFDL